MVDKSNHVPNDKLAGTCHQPHLLKRGKTTMFQPIESTSTPGAKRAPPRGKALWSVMFCSEGNQENGDLFSIQSRYAFNVPDGAVLSLSVCGAKFCPLFCCSLSANHAAITVKCVTTRVTYLYVFHEAAIVVSVGKAV